ncbi:MAG TPA: cobalamin-dependent protein, partial [Myxococcota bacterium]|nr:cobalamin-dependent protein [Myxococcota bacterium]
MSRVLLVNTNVVKAPYPVPPLGLCLLAERLSSRHEVRVHDGTFRGGDGLVETVRAFAPDYVGLGIRNIDDMCLAAPSEYLDDIERLFVTPLRAATDAPLILGGSGFSLYPEILMRRFGAAWGVAGEADGVFPALLDRLDAG